MTDIVEELRQLGRQVAACPSWHQGRRLTAEDTMYWTAADEIAALRSENEALREALKPFADLASVLPDHAIVARVRLCDGIDHKITGRDLSNARAALQSPPLKEKDDV